jgi:4-amino-4-deoxy-L-arabinose transferase-like glycosyltransferase
MKKRILLAYLAIAGWFGLLLALLMPLVIFSNADDVYKSPIFFPLWVFGAILSAAMGATLSILRKKKLSKIGIFLLIVGALSLVGAGYYYFQNENDPEPVLLGQPAIQGTQGN